MKVTLQTDGGARGNPGPAGLGFLVKENGKILFAQGKYLGETTNNQAEYQALIAALAKAKELGATEVLCLMDSELIVKQMQLKYKVKNAGLAPLFLKAWNLTKNFQTCTFKHVPRERNHEADALVNMAIDRRGTV